MAKAVAHETPETPEEAPVAPIDNDTLIPQALEVDNDTLSEQALEVDNDTLIPQATGGTPKADEDEGDAEDE